MDGTNRSEPEAASIPDVDIRSNRKSVLLGRGPYRRPRTQF